MRRLRALIAGLPMDAAVWRCAQAAPTEQVAAQPRQTSSLDAIRKAGGKVIEIHRDKAG